MKKQKQAVITITRNKRGRVWRWRTSNGKGGYCATKRDAINDANIAAGRKEQAV